MSDRWEVRLSGTGGQGIILASIILAEAAVLEGKNVVQTQAYGPEARGGASKGEVIIDESEIDFPKVIKPNLLLTMSKQAFERYKDDVAPGGWFICDASVTPYLEKKGIKAYRIPIIQSTRQLFKTDKVVNMVALGVLAELTGVVGKEALKEGITRRTPKGSEKLNLEAFEAGLRLAKEIKTSRSFY